MLLNSAAAVKKLCEELGIRPTKSKGQNFLIDKNILEKIIVAADLKKSDTVLEVGPGFGILTAELAKRVQKVFSIELDKKLFNFLLKKFADIKNLKIISQDILNFAFRILHLKKYKVVANLPYQITSAVIRKFLENEIKPEVLVLMVQKEVAERVCAKHGKMGLLSVSVQFYGKPEIISKVSKNSFWPIPKVDSAILKITPIKREKINEEDLFRVVRAGFAHPRKQLRRNLTDGLNLSMNKVDVALETAKLNPKVRAEELEAGQWISLTKSLMRL